MQPSLPPGPPYPALIQGIGQWARPLAFLERCRRRYGKRFTVRFPLTPPFVMITDPAEVKQIYTAPPDVLHPGEGARVLQPIVGSRSVILLDGDAHIEQRRLMLPAFHGERMERLTELVTGVTEQAVAAWADERERSLHPRLQSLTLEIILHAVFGLDPGPRLDRLRERLATLLSFGDHPITLLPPPPRLERLLNRAGPLTGFLEAREEIDALLFELIDERRRDSAGRQDVLAMLLEARHEDGTPMSKQELRDELMTLLVAGHETTASTLAWAFERLAREPAVRERLEEDIVAGDGDSYLTATIQETLRRRPVRTARRASSSSRSRSAAGATRRASASSPTPTCSTTIQRSIPILTPSAPSASSTLLPAPTPGSRSAAGAGAAWGRASRCWR
jgi:cytochrome P450